MFDIIIIGGGLAGLVNSILLRRAGLSVLLIEKKKYPFHRVCGEYISNEVIPFLEEHHLFPEDLQPAGISGFRLSSTTGKILHMNLDLGGFGVSRYQYDHWLVQRAKADGVEVKEGTTVLNVTFDTDRFCITSTKGDEVQGVYVIGAFGKRSKLDNELNRSFFKEKSPFFGVKYHIKTREVDPEVIELHNFTRGYCGVSRIEEDVYNLCYLSHRRNLTLFGDIASVEQEILWQNPHLKRIFNHSDFLFDKPEVIHQISFEPKEPVCKHILMSGDSAGMITPLCGNGMAMAIHSAKILSELIISNFDDRFFIEASYSKVWKRAFATRHWTGRKIQSLFGSPTSSAFAVGWGKTFKPMASFLMSRTHGKAF